MFDSKYDLLLKMFQHLFSIVSMNHEKKNLISMQTIMSSILIESDDIPQPLLSVSLANVKKDERKISSITYALAKNVDT